MPRSPAAGSGRSSSAPATAARRGRRGATSSPTPAPPAPPRGTTRRPPPARSSDGGTTGETVGNKFAYDGPTGTHQWYDGTPHPWEFARVWHLEPSLGDPDTVYAGIQDAALFRSTDGGTSWHELPGLREHGSG